MTLGAIEHIEINNDGTISIDGTLYNSAESVIAVYPEFSGGALLEFMFDCDVNTFVGANYD